MLRIDRPVTSIHRIAWALPLVLLAASCGDKRMYMPPIPMDEPDASVDPGPQKDASPYNPFPDFGTIPGVDSNSGRDADDSDVATIPVDAPGTTAPPVCGDGKMEMPETCDDGNATPGDGCDGRCIREPFFECPTPGEKCTSTVVCGDSKIIGSESCDDGNA